jgi:hypothetical protein
MEERGNSKELLAISIIYTYPTPKFLAGIPTLPQGEGSSAIQLFNLSTFQLILFIFM